MNNPILKKIATGLLALLLLFYIGYQIYSANYSSVKTEIAEYVGPDDSGAADSVQTEALVLRKETVMQQGVNGVVTYTVEDGSHVAKNSEVGEIFSTEADAAAQQQLQILEEQIASLQKLEQTGADFAPDQESLKEQIQRMISQTLESITTGDLSSLNQSRTQMLYLLNERQVAVGAVENFSQQIALLQEKKDTLLSTTGSSTGSIVAPSAGVFISKVDGYESILPYDTAEEITVEQFQQFMALEPQIPENSVGKICGEYNWYLVCTMSPNDILNFMEGTTVSIRFPFAASEVVPGTVVAVNQPDRSKEGVVVIESNRMNEETAVLRKETCRISSTQYAGIRISQKAIHFETITETFTDENGEEQTVTREVKGVYVLHGTEIRFRQIIPLYSTSSYVICKQYPEESDQLMTDETVQMYDEVVIEGTDLYDGKIVR